MSKRMQYRKYNKLLKKQFDFFMETKDIFQSECINGNDDFDYVLDWDDLLFSEMDKKWMIDLNKIDTNTIKFPTYWNEDIPPVDVYIKLNPSKCSEYIIYSDCDNFAFVNCNIIFLCSEEYSFAIIKIIFKNQFIDNKNIIFLNFSPLITLDNSCIVRSFIQADSITFYSSSESWIEKTTVFTTNIKVTDNESINFFDNLIVYLYKGFVANYYMNIIKKMKKKNYHINRPQNAIKNRYIDIFCNCASDDEHYSANSILKRINNGSNFISCYFDYFLYPEKIIFNMFKIILVFAVGYMLIGIQPSDDTLQMYSYKDFFVGSFNFEWIISLNYSRRRVKI